MTPEPARLIGRFGGEAPGPLILVLGAVHGNEPAGVRAAERVFAMLRRAAERDPAFRFAGTLTALVGNLAAFAQARRFVDRDLNRNLGDATLARVSRGAPAAAEDGEAVDLIAAVRAEIAAAAPTRVILVDVHTTTAQGGAFTIPGPTPLAGEIAAAMSAPVVYGMLDGLRDTTLHFFTPARLGLPVDTVIFEAGQHSDALSVELAVGALAAALRVAGALPPGTDMGDYEAQLRRANAHLPDAVELRHRHGLTEGDGFAMEPGWVNFAPVAEGQVVARDVGGAVASPVAGLMLMPLYQALGEDGYFVVGKRSREMVMC